MYSDDIDKSYISSIDRFLFEFDNNHVLSDSQIQEIKKYQKIFNLRDNANTDEAKEGIWKEF